MSYYGIEVHASSSSLSHHGIKGQKWGVRRYQNEDGSLTSAGERRYKRLAKKDAKEYARAKMYYGEGAGNRRKLIKATVNERSKKSKAYAEEFEKQLASQDMAKHASAAKRERHTNDVKNETGKVGRSVVNIVAGNPQRAAASVLAVYGVLHFTGLDKIAVQKGSEFVKNAVNDYKFSHMNASELNDYLRNNLHNR